MFLKVFFKDQLVECLSESADTLQITEKHQTNSFCNHLVDAFIKIVNKDPKTN